MNKRFTALLAAGLLLTAGLTGCGGSKSSTTVIQGNIEQTEAVTLPPGVEYTANKGEEYNYSNLSLKINFTELALTSDEPDSKGRYPYAMVFSAENNGDAVADVRMLDDFKIAIDGVPYEENIFTALATANAALAYEGEAQYDALLEPGDKITGFVPFALNTMEWNTLTITYSPDRSRTNDTIVYTVDRSELVNKF